MGHTRSQYETRIRSRLGDLGLAQHIEETQIPIALEEALITFSKDRPRQISQTLTGDGTAQSFDLSTLLTEWAVAWSRIASIEHPVGSVPPSRLDPSRYELEDETGRLLIYTAPDGDFRISYLGIYPFPDDTPATDLVPEVYVPAVSALAASIALRSKAHEYARQQSTSVAGDLFRRDAEPLYRGAADLEKVYTNTVLGRPTGGDQPAQVALAVGDVDVFPGSLFHRRSDYIAAEGLTD